MTDRHVFVHLAAEPLVANPDVAVVRLATSEPVQAFALADLDLSNATAEQLLEIESGRHWSFILVPRSPGSFAVALAAGALSALNGTPSRASNRLVRFHDAPAAVIEGPRPILDGPAQLTIRWSKSMPAFDPADLRTDGLVLDEAAQVDARTWTLRATPLLHPTEVAVVVPAGITADALGTPNAAARWQSYAIPPPPLPVRPVLEEVRTEEDGSYTAVWGYLNDNPARVVRIPPGSDNRFVPGPRDRGQPEVFLPGRHIAVFETPFTGGNLVWSLRSPNGTNKTATAGTP